MPKPSPHETRRGRLKNGNAGRLQPGTAVRGEDPARDALPVPSNVERTLSLHGGLSTGPKTGEGTERIRRAVTRHGRYSAAAKAERRYMRELLSHCRATLRISEGVNGETRP